MQKSMLVRMLIVSMLLSQVSFVGAVSIPSESILDEENTLQTQDIPKTIQNITDKDPAQFVPNTIISDQGKFTFEQKSYNISMDINPNDKHITFTKNNVSIGISMPNQKNTSSMKNINGQVISREKFYDVVIQSIDGGMRYVLNINSPKADKSYDFKMDLPTGYRLTQDKNGNVTILDMAGKIYASIAKPWAKDANGKEIKTWYAIKGSTLTQHVDFNKNTVFPIVADPIWCGQTIASTFWKYRPEYAPHSWSLTVEPTACGKWSGVYTPAGYWEDLINMTPASDLWNPIYVNSKYWSMYDQLICHVDFAAGAKTPWQLEPSRPNVGYGATVMAKCNPN